jgi:aspartate kinase
MAIACKFGGSSVADSNQIKKVAKIIKSNPERRFIVVSAPGKRNDADKKVTDLLYLAHETAKNGLDPKSVLDIIKERYDEIIRGLEMELDLSEEFAEIATTLGSESTDYAASRGEFLNGKVIAHYLDATFIDPYDHIFIESDGQLNEDKTYTSLKKQLEGPGLFLVPGFYGQGENGRVKTFSRGGSDITGAILAHAIHADVYENWTDVSGLLMADPRIVDSPLAISEVSYTELRELSYMGAQVLHDEAIFPAKALGIPVNIKNTNDPDNPGTKIVAKAKHRAFPVVGLAGKKGFEIIYMQKTLMNKEVGFGRRLLGLFEAKQINFEHLPSGIDSVSVVVKSEELDPHRKSILEDIQSHLKVDELKTFPNIALIAVVGSGMAYHPGVAATVFKALADANVNIRLIDQGASELNIIIGVQDSDFDKSINALYSAISTNQKA